MISLPSYRKDLGYYTPETVSFPRPPGDSPFPSSGQNQNRRESLTFGLFIQLVYLMKIHWKGVFPAMLSPFTPEDQLDLPCFSRNLEALLAAGVHGIILGGSLGEASTLDPREKGALLERALEQTGGRIPVLMNIAESSTRNAVRAARDAQGLGASGLMLLPPMRYRADERETLEFLGNVVTATSLPVMIYNNPVDYGIGISLEQFGELAKYDQVQAIKESSRDLGTIYRLIRRFGDRFGIFCGVDTLVLESLLAGADGWVCGLGDAFPSEAMALFRLIQDGRIREARDLYSWFMPLLELDLHPKLVQYIKLAAACTGLGSEGVRAPRLEPDSGEKARILALIRDRIACRPGLPKFPPVTGTLSN